MFIDKLAEHISELVTYIPKHEIKNEKISSVSIGWQIAHSLLTVNGIIESLRKSEPQNYKWHFNLSRLYVFTANQIPRGKGKAPSIVKPLAHDIETIEKLLYISRERIVALKDIPNNHYFNHPYFGHLKKQKTIKFIRLHTAHHLKIVNDIMGNQNGE